jgi:Hypothetical glycosyl hydrolase family 15
VRLRLVLALTLMLLALPTVASATVGHVRVAINSDAAFSSYEKSARRYGVVILHAWQQDRLRALKQANPDVKVLVYKNLSFAAEGRSWSGQSSTGVNADEAEREHPEWFLRNTDGDGFTSWSYRWQWAMDVGSESYQRRWADNVVFELVADGWDGVFMDDTNPTMKYHYDVDRVARYPSDAAYGAATASALAHIAPRVRAAGKLVFVNLGSWSEYPAVGRRWLDFVDGAMDEMFLKWGDEPGEGYMTERWETQLNALKATQRRGKTFLGISHSSSYDRGVARYGYATMLLGGEGDAHFALAHDYTKATWFPEYDYDLGRPMGPERAVPGGVHRRQFERGLVLVNPTPQSREVSLGGTYSGSGLSDATHATMPPTSGLVLRRVTDHGPAREPPKPPTVLATAKGSELIELRWTGFSPRAKRFRILRNGRRMGTVRGRGFRDRRVRGGRRYRYRVVAVSSTGRRVGASRPVRIRVLERRRKRRPAAARAASVPVRAALGSRRLRSWKRAYVEQRVGRRWRPITVPVRPSRAMRFRLRLPRRGAVRLVVEAPRRVLRSGRLRPRR